MSDPLFDTSDGNTPIDEDEAQGLRLSWVRTRGDLNEAEAANLLEARQAIRSPSVDQVLNDLWLRRLHERLFGDVWSWAGTYRRSDRNIGIDWTAIPATVHVLVEDCRTWVAVDGTKVPMARFHHEGTTELRAAYLRALRTADRDPDDLDPLVDFMWS